MIKFKYIKFISEYQQKSIYFKIGTIILLIYIFVAIFSPYIAPDPSNNANRQNADCTKLPPFSYVYLSDSNQNQPVSYFFLLGTDVLGRDILSRLMLAGRVSLTVGFLSVIFGLIIGVSIGLISGYFGGIIDRCLQGIMTLVWALPSVLLALILSFILDKGILQLCLAIGLTLWVDMARIIRGKTMILKEMEFVQAGKSIGLRTIPLIFTYILPNLKQIILILACSNFATAVLLEAGLSFLGMGISPPTPSWGNMIYEGYNYIILEQGKWIAFYPALVLVILILSINIVSSGLKGADGK